jgi:excisionase family DNA binding protein
MTANLQPSRDAKQPLLQIDVAAIADALAELLLARLVQALEPSSPWMNVELAATYLACSAERIRKLVQQRKIPFHQERSGSRLFFHRGELDEWLLTQ